MKNIPPFPSDPGLIARAAVKIRAEVERFTGRWTPLPDTGPRLSFTWEELERQLVDLAPTELQAELVRRLVERTRLFAELKPSEMVLREVLCVAALVLDPRFDFSRTYWMVVGIAGVDPLQASPGSAAWAKYVVDADPVFGMLVEACIGFEGAAVVSAASMAEARPLVTEVLTGLVVEPHLPDGDGHELLELVAARCPAIPVVLCATGDDPIPGWPGARVARVDKADLARIVQVLHLEDEPDHLPTDRLLHLTALDIADPWDALVWFCEHCIGEQQCDRGLTQVLANTDVDADKLGGLREEIGAAVDDVVRRAQEAGLVRADLAYADLAINLHVLSRMSVEGSEVWRRYLALFLSSIRAQPGQDPLPGPSPTFEKMRR